MLLKRTGLFVALVCLVFLGCQEEERSSESSNTDKFAELTKDDSFKQAHRLPGDFKLEDGKGEMISYPVDDGGEANAYFVEGRDKPDRYILVFHEWYGLNEYVKKESEKLAMQFPGANILALDLYDGKVATTRDEAGKYVQEVDNDRALAIIQGASEWAGADAKIATLGWCFGGGWSLQAALELGNKAKACVIYYGMPIMDAEKLQDLKAPVLGIFAKQDGSITPEKVDSFEAAMEEAGKSLEVHSYDAHHAFANPTRDIYKPEAAEKAWDQTVRFLQRHLFK